MHPVTFSLANHTSRCPQCRGWIEPGDLIAKQNNKTWFCGECALEPLRPHLGKHDRFTSSRIDATVADDITTDLRMRTAAGLAPLAYIVFEDDHGRQSWKSLDDTSRHYATVLGGELSGTQRFIACWEPDDNGTYRRSELVVHADTTTAVE